MSIEPVVDCASLGAVMKRQHFNVDVGLRALDGLIALSASPALRAHLGERLQHPAVRSFVARVRGLLASHGGGKIE